MSRILCFFLSWIVMLVAHGSVVVLQANESFPYWSKNLPHNGLGGEIIAAMSEVTSLETHIEFRPLKRLIEDTTNNDLGNPAFYMVNQDFAAIIPFAISEISLYYYNPTHKKSILFKTLQDLKGYRIGALSGTITNRTLFEQ